MKLNSAEVGRRRKVGYCTDIHVRRGGNMVYINCEVLILLCCICLFLYTALIYLVVKLSYQLTSNSGIYSQVVRDCKVVVQTR